MNMQRTVNVLLHRHSAPLRKLNALGTVYTPFPSHHKENKNELLQQVLGGSIAGPLAEQKKTINRERRRVYKRVHSL